MATSTSNISPPHLCVNCHKDASKSCGACQGAPNGSGGESETTWYCGSECQKGHWVCHKVACKACQERKILYRAGETAQLLFYIYREIVFDKNILKVEKKENEILLYEGSYDVDCFVPFPTALFPDECDKQAILTYMACGDAIGYMHEVLKSMIKGVISQSLEVSVDTANRQRLKLTTFEFGVREDKMNHPHEVLQVVLKSGEAYVVDLTGAQYGHYESVVPSDTDFQTRANSVLERQTFGHQQRLMTAACGPHSWTGVIRDCNKKFCQCLNTMIDEWQKENILLIALLKLPRNQFLQQQRQLTAFVDEILRDFKQWAEKGGDLKVIEVDLDDGNDLAKMGCGANGRHEDSKNGQSANNVGSARTYEEDIAKLLSGSHKVLDMPGW